MNEAIATMFETSLGLPASVADPLGMFTFLAVELTVLFLLISFVIGIVLDYLPNERIQQILGSKGGKGYVSAGLLGAITPFCSCSTIPMLAGLLKARAGFGPTITFLFTSPLLNPIIIGLFFATFGMKVTVVYFLIALIVSILGGYVLEKLGFERYVKQEVVSGKVKSGCATGCGDSKPAAKTSCCDSNKPAPVASGCGCGCGPAEPVAASASCCASTEESDAEDNFDGAALAGGGCCTTTTPTIKVNGRWVRLWAETWNQFKKVFPALMIGVGIGSLIYGVVPVDFIAKYAGPENPLAIPFAAIIGVPLYIRAEAVIPLAAALGAKGMGMGAVMALIIGSAGASLTEVILLKSLFRNPMIAAFLLVIFAMAISAGLIFTFIK